MLWLCIHLPALPLEALLPPPDCPVAVIENEGEAQKLICVNRLAAERGVSIYMRQAAALAISPDLRVLCRNPVAEKATLESVACWAERFGTPTTFNAATTDVWVEIESSLPLFGGWRGLRQRIEQDAQTLDWVQAYGVAPSLSASALMARAGAGLKLPVLNRVKLETALAHLPLRFLPFDGAVFEVLLGSGLRTVGELLKLPGDSLARRFGEGVPRYLAQLIGREPEVWKSYTPPMSYRRTLDLDFGIETTEALQFPLRRMLKEFAWYLRARDVAVQQFDIQLRGPHRQTVQLEIRLLAPTRDDERFMLVVRERLETLTLTHPVEAILLSAERFEKATAAQRDLFDIHDIQGERFDTLRERLAARLGVDAIRTLSVVSDHRPERAWAVARSSAETDFKFPSRPLWLLPKPEPISAPRPLSPPERIEQGWWDGRQELRDYCIAEDASGRRLWVFREPGNPQWYLHGLWQ